jgi:ABC-type multidrug transport system ATPase subunit
VLILDEPTVGLDPIQIQEIRALIKELGSAGEHAVILSTHILAEVEAICDRVILIHQGRKVEDSPLADLVAGGRRLEELLGRASSRDVVAPAGGAPAGAGGAPPTADAAPPGGKGSS